MKLTNLELFYNEKVKPTSWLMPPFKDLDKRCRKAMDRFVGTDMFNQFIEEYNGTR